MTGTMRYKPAALRWPFLVAQMALLTAAIVAVVLLQALQPNSDDSAVVDGRPSRVRRTFPRDVNLAQTQNSISEEIVNPPTTSTSQNDTMVLTCVSVGPSESATAACFTTITTKSKLSLAGFKPTGFAMAKHPPQASVNPTRSYPSLYNTSAASTSTQPLERPTSDFFDPDGDPTVVTTGEGGRLPSIPIATLITRTDPDIRIPWTEPIFGAPTKEPKLLKPITTTILSTVADDMTTVVTLPPRTVISTAEPTVITESTIPPLTTIVATADGTRVTLVSTPPPQPILKTVDGSVVTFVETRPPETIVRKGSGSVVTLIAAVTPGTEPATEKVVTTIGGVPTTFTRVVTPLQPITTAIPTTVDSTLTTMSLTLIPITTAFETTINGTPTTMSLTMTLTPTAEATPTAGLRQSNATSASQEVPPNNGTRVYAGVSKGQYFAGTFLPPLLAVLLALPFSIIELNVKLFQPFSALTTPEGATGPDSLTLRYVGIDNVLIPVRQLLHGQPIPFLASLLMWLSWLMAPLAAEAIGFKVHGTCSHLSISGCALALGVSPAPARALTAVMLIMLALLVVLAVLLHRWETGVARNPWSLADTALLARDPLLRDRLSQTPNHAEVTESDLTDMFRHGRFHLEPQPLSEKDSSTSPAIIPHWNTPTWDIPFKSTLTTSPDTRRKTTPFPALTYPVRLFFVLLHLGLITLLTYYHLLRSDTPFELFMDSQSFGVKFLFAAIGSLFGLFWSCFFLSLGAMEPFRILSSQHHKLHETALTRPPATNPFSGIYRAVENKRWLLLAASAMALLAGLLPAFLANVPYSLTQSLISHRVCTFAVIGILSAMVLVLVASMCTPWPHMPVDPRTVAGMMYYVAGPEELLQDVVDAKRREGEWIRRDGEDAQKVIMGTTNDDYSKTAILSSTSKGLSLYVHSLRYPSP
ncbi:hypothetical protein QBC34DRAFT_472580 [Podospora aff. communis PSN243]|uniref:Zonadhesin n=1 Tax=Podospora aff. communis PSN243 TaxID=3040156 RepID=A0AAV9GAY0_9PEZI|nr:hypothetical protein QBC34DRAFT_472580 [Podospora aff. communis PSN243]